ncbi:MAG: hypothetical protein M0Z46_16805 [Actinomycetota bacterium]|nr:hypothetical protein [Actinomycetota bacterium]
MSEAAGPGPGRCTAGVHLGLRPRPDIDPLVVALVAAAALELWSPEPAGAEEGGATRRAQAERAWRFSGRPWMRRPPLGRDRPWVR